MGKFVDVLEIKNGKNQRQVENPSGQYPIYGSGGIMGYSDDYLCEANTVIIGRKGSINNPIYVGEPFWNVDTAFGLVAKREVLFPKYLYYFCRRFDFEKLNTTVTIPSLTKANLLQVEIPLPPLDVQKKIANILDQATYLIEKRKAQIAKLDLFVKSQFIEMFGDPVTNPVGWGKKHFEKTCVITTGNTPPRANLEYYGDYIEWIKTDNINATNSILTTASEYLSEIGFEKCRYVEKNSILMTCIAGSLSSIGNVAITNRRVAFNQQINALIPQKKEYDYIFLYWLLRMMKPTIHNAVNMMLKGILSKGNLSAIEAITPPIDLQNRFAVFVVETEKSKAKMQQGLVQLELLYKSLMQKCFEGEIIE